MLMYEKPCLIPIVKDIVRLLAALDLLKYISDIVCVEVLQPSQPNGVMSSAVSLPSHTFTGQV